MTKVKAKWVDGNLVFYNHAGEAIVTFDANGNLVAGNVVSTTGASGEFVADGKIITVEDGLITGIEDVEG